MSDMIEILDTHDVEDIVREWINHNADHVEGIVSEWVAANIYDFVPSQDDVERMVEMGIESEVEYGSIDTALEEIKHEVNDLECQIDEINGTESRDLKHLEERVADLERRNAQLLTSLGQFMQLLTHRDLI